MAEPPSCAALFFAFLKIGLMGFGGVGPIALHVVVQEKGWLNEKEFSELLGLCQSLPGANTVNLAVMLGDRYRGGVGALSALAGLMLVPLVAVLTLASVYDKVAQTPRAHAMLSGAAASAAGLILGTGLKLLRRVRAPASWGVAALAVVSVAFLRLPLLLALGLLLPLSVASVLLRQRGR